MPAWDWVSIIGTGQSLAVGGHGDLPEEPFGGTRQRFANLKLSLGDARVPPFDATNAALSMVPLVEPLRAIASSYPSAYPANIYGQSFHTAMADQVTTLVRAALARDYVTVHTAVGEAGQAFDVIAKGATDTGTTGRAYAASLFEVAAIARLARAAGKSYGVGAIVVTHGESDADSATVRRRSRQLWSSYNRDVAALTGQTASIPLLVSQQHATPTAAGEPLARHARPVDRGRRPSRRRRLLRPQVSISVHHRRPAPDQPRLRSPRRKVRPGLRGAGRARPELAATATDARHPRRPDHHRRLPHSGRPTRLGERPARPPPVGRRGVGAGTRVRGPGRVIPRSRSPASRSRATPSRSPASRTSPPRAWWSPTPRPPTAPRGTAARCAGGSCATRIPSSAPGCGTAQPNYCVAFELDVP